MAIGSTLLRTLLLPNDDYRWNLFRMMWKNDQRYWRKRNKFSFLIYLFLHSKGFLKLYEKGEPSEERIIRCNIEDGNHKVYIANMTPKDNVLYDLMPKFKQYITKDERITEKHFKPAQDLRACSCLVDIEPNYLLRHYNNFVEDAFSKHSSFSANRVDDDKEVVWSYKNNKEFARFIVNLFNIQKGKILNPNAGIGYLQSYLSRECEIRSSTSDTTKELLSAIFHGENYIRYNTDLVGEEDTNVYDYIIWNPLADGMEIADMADKCYKIYDIIKNRLSVHGKAAIVTTNHLWYRSIDHGMDFDIADKFVEYEYLNTIIFIGKGLSIAVFDKQKQRSSIRIIDKTSMAELSAEILLDDIVSGESSYFVSLEEIEKMDGYIDLEFLKRKDIDITPQNGFKLVELKDILEPYTGNKRTGMKNELSIESISFDKEYSTTESVITAKDGSIYTFADCNNYIEKEILLINSFERENTFQPTLFCPSKGGAIFDDFIGYTYSIKDDVVDKRYLINEMRKPYFLEQLYPCGRKIYTYNHHEYTNHMFLGLKVYIPDVTATSIERQRQLLREEKELEMELLVKRFNSKHIGKNSQFLCNGTELNKGKYTIIGPIGSGGFGKTYKATYDHREVAIKEFFYEEHQMRGENGKEVLTTFGESEDVQKVKDKFRREAQKIQEFTNNPHIVTVYETFDENNTCYYSMEYIEGCDLKKYCQKRGGVIGEEEAIAIIRQVASALKTLHSKQYNHYDVKPNNILIDTRGRAVLIDFGTAHKHVSCYGDEYSILQKERETTLLKVLTPGYLPEYAYNTGCFHAGIDIYSLGATLYNIITGLQPHNAIISSSNPNPYYLSEKTWSTIKAAMQNDPDKSLNSIDEFLKHLNDK